MSSESAETKEREMLGIVGSVLFCWWKEQEDDDGRKVAKRKESKKKTTEEGWGPS